MHFIESEYLALSQAMRDLILLRETLKEVNLEVFKKHVQDNTACLKFARLPRLTPRTKHIAAPYHWFRSKVEEMEISIKPIST